MNKSQLTIIGRSSSHFTRTVRIFAAELDVAYQFEVVQDLMSSSSESYAGNPALRVPILRTEHGEWFGSLNICRELARRSSHNLNIVWPEQCSSVLLANAQELTLQAMATEVTLIMATSAKVEAENKFVAKYRTGLINSIEWLERHVVQVLVELAANRELSYLEVCLYCLITHLEFRKVLPMAQYTALNQFAAAFANRQSVQSTEYRFDTP